MQNKVISGWVFIRVPKIEHQSDMKNLANLIFNNTNIKLLFGAFAKMIVILR